MRKKILFSLTAVLLLAISGALLLNQHSPIDTTSVATPPVQTFEKDASDIASRPGTSTATIEKEKKEVDGELATANSTTYSTSTFLRATSSSDVPPPRIDKAHGITLTVGEKEYLAPATTTNVLAVMRSLTETTDLSFTGEDHPGMGYFVRSINGQSEGDGWYWILRVNNVLAPVGVSQSTVAPGDIVTWRFEKGY